MGPVKGEIQPEDRENDRATDAPRPHGMHRRPAAPTENSRQVIKKMITAQGRKQKHSARKGNRRFHRGKGHTGCLSNKINPFCSSVLHRQEQTPPNSTPPTRTSHDARRDHARKRAKRTGKTGNAVRSAPAYSAASTRVLRGEYSSGLRKVRCDLPQAPAGRRPFRKRATRGSKLRRNGYGQGLKPPTMVSGPKELSRLSAETSICSDISFL